MKKFGKACAVFLGMLFAFTMAGCAKVTTKVPVSVLPDYDAQKETLRLDIAGWCAPEWCVPEDPANAEQIALSDKHMQLMKDCGLNVIHANYAGDGTLQVAMGAPTAKDAFFFEQLEKYGLSTYINIGRSPEMLQFIGNYSAYDAVRGYQYDEPQNSKEVDDFVKYLDAFNRDCAGKTFVVNMQPPTGNMTYGGYDEYIEDIAESVTQNLSSASDKWISADSYPLHLKDGTYSLWQSWLGNIGHVAKYGKQYGFKKNYFMQAMPYSAGANDRVPAYDEIRLQEYSLLAFGMDSISLFCYQTPQQNFEFSDEQVAMIDREGNPTPIYDAVKKVNAEVLEFDHVYLQFDWKGVFTSDKGVTESARSRSTYNCFQSIADRLSVADVASVSSVRGSENTLYGYFGDDYGNDGFMVVNYNDPHNVKNNTVTMNFNAAYGYTKAVVYAGGKKSVKDIRGNTLTLELGAGEGVFVIPYVA